MSELAKTARAAMKSKAHRMAGAGPGMDKSKSIDASGWREPTDMNTGAQVGARPVSRRMFKRGGAVEGDCAPKRADRKARASGGRGIVDEFINRDVKEANSKFGKPHEGGWASGGATNFRKQMMHPDAAADKRLIKHMVKPKALRTAKRDGGGKWIQSAIKHPGALHKELGVAKGEKIPAKKLNKAAHSDNPKLAKRAELAKTLGRMHKAGGGAADVAGMRPKGGRIAKAHGGSSRKKGGKTNIIIGIHAGQPQQQPMMAGGQPRPPMPQQAPPPQMAPPPGAGGMPPGMPPGMMPQPGMQGAPQFPRKSGGRAMRKEGGPVVGAKYSAADPDKAERVKTTQDIPAGNGGVGRLAKRSIAQRTYVRPA